jgi:hypothetical protein
MKFGVREICDVVLKAKAAQKIGNKIFYAGEPVIYFDTLKTSSMEGAATTVYAQGGRGNARLVAWEGERTVTFTMEDALISPEGFMILSGAGLIEASADNTIKQHMTETVDKSGINPTGEGEGLAVEIHLSEKPFLDADFGDCAYVMFMLNGEIVSEPYIPVHGENGVRADEKEGYWITVKAHEGNHEKMENEKVHSSYKLNGELPRYDAVLVDYYVERDGNASQIEITADKFGGNYYLEASTLFRDQNGVDMPAEFIIPNCKIQSNFTFTMASSGDPSSFTFTMDAFPDYTRFDKSKKVLAAIQIIKEAGSQALYRHSTTHEAEHDKLF